MRSRRPFLRPLWVLLCAALLALLSGCYELNHYDGPEQYPDSLWINDAGTLCFIPNDSSRNLYGEMEQNGAVQPVVLSLDYRNGASLYPYEVGSRPSRPKGDDAETRLLWAGRADYDPPESFTLKGYWYEKGATLPTGEALPMTFYRVDCTEEEILAVAPWELMDLGDEPLPTPEFTPPAGFEEYFPDDSFRITLPRDDFTPGALLELGRRVKDEDRPLRPDNFDLRMQRTSAYSIERTRTRSLVGIILFLLVLALYLLVCYRQALTAARRYINKVHGCPCDVGRLFRKRGWRIFRLTIRPKAPSTLPPFALELMFLRGRWQVLQDDLPLAMLADTLRQRLAPPLQALWGSGATVRLELESRALCTMPREEAFRLSMEQQLELPFERQQIFLELPEPFDPQTQLDALWQSVETIRAVAPRWNSLFLGRKDAPPDGWLRFRPLARFAEPEDLLCEVEHQRTANPFYRP